MPTSLSPMLTVRGAAALVDFYERAFGAEEVTRVVAPTGQAVIAMSIAGSQFYIVDENPAAFNVSPATAGATTVRVNLIVDDPDAVMRAAIAAGAKEIFPIGDQPYGMRQGRVADPAGHHWLIGRPLR
jgi:PhnB protein